jgi:predicted ferric reductase
MMKGRPPLRGIPPVLLVPLYFALALAPLALAALQMRFSRGWSADFSSGIAMAGLALLLAQFFTSGRFERTTGRVGIDLMIRAHQLAARLILLLLLLHPAFAAGLGSRPLTDAGTTLAGMLGSPALWTGVVAWVLLVVQIATAIWRDRLPVSYETWRIAHGLGSLTVAALGVQHALTAGVYTDRVLVAFWLALLLAAMAALAVVYVVTPFRQLRRPWRIASVRSVGDRLWELDLAPAAPFAMQHEGGQFYWLTLARSPFRITEHPFSATSCSADLPHLRFLIKESGDFTRRIGALPAGAAAYVDGPRGIFTLRAAEAAPGIGLIAGGVGIAPILGILRQLRADGDKRPVRLLFANRHVGQIPYRDELDGLAATLDYRVHYVLSEPPAGWDGDIGLIDRGLLERVFSHPQRGAWTYYVCGPTPMMDLVEQELRALGIADRQVIAERFRYH